MKKAHGPDLVEIMGEATLRAAAAHGTSLGMTPDEQVARLPHLRTAVAEGWNEFIDTLNQAVGAQMGEPMYRQIMNTYANAWAVQGLKRV